jgi:excisionase family DNA binding protein
MSGTLDAEYLTVPEAATALRVSASTIWRWIDGGRLPAYRVGRRKVRVKSADLAALITSARPRDEQRALMISIEQRRGQLARSLTSAEKDRALAAMDAIEALDREILDRHGQDQFVPSSADLLNEVREERARELA